MGLSAPIARPGQARSHRVSPKGMRPLLSRPGAGRGARVRIFIFNTRTVARSTTGIGFAGAVRFPMPLGLMSGGPFRPFSRDFFALCGDRLLQCRNLAEQFCQQGFKIWSA